MMEEWAAETYWREISQAGDGTVTVGKGGRGDKVGEASEDEEGSIGVLARILRSKFGSRGHGIGNTSELANVTAGKLDSTDVGAFLGYLGDKVRVEINSARSSWD
jgi:hypothetical protein